MSARSRGDFFFYLISLANIRRTCIKEVPDNLILHLKRFDFDMETLLRKKLNDHFEFPTELDLAPFLAENVDKDPSEMNDVAKQEYVLSGVLVHSGTADSGHYYSYIKSRDESKEGTWFLFNDSLVEKFDSTSIPETCFGGTGRTGFKSLNFSNAYMLL